MSFSPFRSALLITAISLTCLIGNAAFAEDDDEESASKSNAALMTQMEMRVSGVEEQMRSLTGRLEQIDYGIRRMDQALQRLQSDYDARLMKLESAAQQQSQAAPAPAAAAMQAPRVAEQIPTTEEEESSATTASLAAPTHAAASVVGKTATLSAKSSDIALSPQDQYDRAFGLLRQANYDEAEKAFKSFIDKNPKDKLLGNAKYWYAETHYVRGHFKEAAVAFADAYERDMQGTKAPDSLLKLSLSLAGLNKADDACNTLNVLKTKYPKAPAAVRARADQEHAQLKCK